MLWGLIVDLLAALYCMGEALGVSQHLAPASLALLRSC